MKIAFLLGMLAIVQSRELRKNFLNVSTNLSRDKYEKKKKKISLQPKTSSCAVAPIQNSTNA